MKNLTLLYSLSCESLEPKLLLTGYDPSVDSNLGFNIGGFYEQGPEGAADWTNAIQEMYNLGVDDVTLVLYRVLDHDRGTFVAGSGPKLDHVKAALIKAKQLGMDVTLSTVFETDAAGGWRGDWNPIGAVRQRFYTSYTELATSVAGLAQQYGADRFTFASELEQFTRNSAHAPFLSTLINEIDAVYAGDIGYGSTAANIQNSALKSTVWDHPKIDYVAVSAYFTNYFADNATADASARTPEADLLAHFESKWNDLFDNVYLPYVQSLRGGAGMPFYIQEFGAVPFNRTAVANWSIAPGVDTGARSEVPDAQEQRLLYESLINATDGRGDEISNVFFWTWAFGGNDADLYGINPNRALASQPTGQLIRDTFAEASYSVEILGDTATIVGTDRNDTFKWAVNETRTTVYQSVWVNGDPVPLPANIERIKFNGLGGDDSLNLTAGRTDDRVVIKPNSVVVTCPTFRVIADNFENVLADGGLGNDLATVIGADGDDTYVGRFDSVRLSSDDFSFRADNFERTNVYGKEGANTAVFYDSRKHDRFTSSAARTTMRDLGFTYTNSVFGFDFVSATSDNGGKDTALLFDRETDDQLISDPSRTRLESLSGEFTTQVDGFAEVHSYSTAGGQDAATLKGREGKKDILIARPTEVRFQAKNKAFYNEAVGFEHVHAYATPKDQDQAYIHDSAGDDTLVAKPLNVTFTNSLGNSQRFTGFRTTTAYATTGHDTAIFYDSAVNDRFVARPAHTIMRANNGHYVNKVFGFDTAQAFALAGGSDTSYMYDSHRVDVVTMSPDVTTMADMLGTYSFESRGFERSYAYGGTKSKDVGSVTVVDQSESIKTTKNRITVKSLDGSFWGRLNFFTHTTTTVVGI